MRRESFRRKILGPSASDRGGEEFRGLAVANGKAGKKEGGASCWGRKWMQFDTIEQKELSRRKRTKADIHLRTSKRRLGRTKASSKKSLSCRNLR